jgi:hypothetical protein
MWDFVNTIEANYGELLLRAALALTNIFEICKGQEAL